MNALLGGSRHTFTVGHELDACTAGVDLGLAMMPPSCLSTGDAASSGDAADEAKTEGAGDDAYRVAFVDVEGQGDQSVERDVALALPILLTSKVVLFNWKGGPQVNSMLNNLATLVTAARRVAMEEEMANPAAEGDFVGLFGHLHVVMRDQELVGTPEELRRKLFDNERGRTKAVSARNDIRNVLKDEFESLSVHFLPRPSGKVTVEDMAALPEVATLRATIAGQLAGGPKLFRGKPVTGTVAADLMPHLVETVNTSEEVSLKAAWVVVEEAMVARMLQELNDLMECKMRGEINTLKSDELNWVNDAGMEAFQATVRDWCASALDGGEPAVSAARLSALSEPRRSKLCAQLEAVCAAAIEAALEDNAEQMMQWASERVAAIQAAAGSKSTDKLEVTLCELHTTEAHLGEVTDELRQPAGYCVHSTLRAGQGVCAACTSYCLVHSTWQ